MDWFDTLKHSLFGPTPSPAVVSLLMADWPARLGLVDLLQDQSHPDMDAVMWDVLRAPGEGDPVDLPLAVAPGYLDEDLDQFVAYYNDRKLLRQTVDRVLDDLGLARDAPTEAPRVAAAPQGLPPESPGEPALLTALQSDRFDEALRLVAKGADPNARRETAGQPAIWWAATRGSAPVVQALIDHGAQVGATDRWQSTALHCWSVGPIRR